MDGFQDDDMTTLSFFTATSIGLLTYGSWSAHILTALTDGNILFRIGWREWGKSRRS